MRSYTITKRGWARFQRLVFAGGLVLVLLASMPAAWALGARSYYPYALQPTLPDAAEALRLVAEFPRMLYPFRSAHQQSLQQGWKSIAPPLSAVEDKAESMAPIVNN